MKSLFLSLILSLVSSSVYAKNCDLEVKEKIDVWSQKHFAMTFELSLMDKKKIPSHLKKLSTELNKNDRAKILSALDKDGILFYDHLEFIIEKTVNSTFLFRNIVQVSEENCEILDIQRYYFNIKM